MPLVSSVGVPLAAAAVFFVVVAVAAVLVHLIRSGRQARRRREGLLVDEDGWVRSAAPIAGEGARYACAAMRKRGAVIEIWGADDPAAALPPPRDARPFAAEEPEKPVGAAIELGLDQRAAKGLVERVLRSAGAA